MHPLKQGQNSAPILSPRDVIQVAFILEHDPNGKKLEPDDSNVTSDNRQILGQLAIQWRGALGDRGSLSTGWLTSRR